MKCVDTFATNEKAQEVRALLKAKGIEAKVTVDPVDSLYPAHGGHHHGGVAVMVNDKDLRAAEALVRPVPMLRAS